MKILTVVGARPQFIKAAMLSRAIVQHNEQGGRTIVEEIVHTGQHFDDKMSRVFFDQLDLPAPVVNLEIRATRHGEMIGTMLMKIEDEIIRRAPDLVLVYGDTNTTAAGALAASKLQIPVAHVEAGLRSYNRRMPEEINRVVTDHLSRHLFCPTTTAVENLAAEGITKGVAHVGDVMYDASVVFGEIAERESSVLAELDLEDSGYYLATVHRAENTDSKPRLEGIVRGLIAVSAERPVVLPLHPRTLQRLEQLGELPGDERLRIIEPVSFLDMIQLERGAKVILTDSGGVQKEAYFHGVPCVTLRDETEWVETVEAGWNQLAGASPERIVAAVRGASPGSRIPEYGDGRAAVEVIDLLCANAFE